MVRDAIFPLSERIAGIPAQCICNCRAHVLPHLVPQPVSPLAVCAYASQGSSISPPFFATQKALSSFNSTVPFAMCRVYMKLGGMFV